MQRSPVEPLLKRTAMAGNQAMTEALRREPAAGYVPELLIAQAAGILLASALAAAANHIPPRNREAFMWAQLDILIGALRSSVDVHAQDYAERAAAELAAETAR